ncbi:hypothetical protein V500_02450 [Pseudogymnoascus sp. VKM F-4518 (FW-2643)]|nr:hypothetical protein V500_02450 [Pseudogymnoascus sp. VKM F-4518 (FW-2643)]
MKEGVTGIADDETKLKDKAKDMINQDVYIGQKETGSGDYIWKEWPEVVGVIVYKNGGVGSVKVTGGNERSEIEATGPNESGVVMIVVNSNQTCMLSEFPTVRYIYTT